MENFEMNDELFHQLTDHDIEIFKIYNRGNYEKENLVLIANKHIESFYDYILVYMVEREDGLPDYEKCRFLTFDDLEVKQGDRIRVYTCKGEDHEQVDLHTGKHYDVVYWNLPKAIWDEPRSSVEIMERGDSYSVGFDR